MEGSLTASVPMAAKARFLTTASRPWRTRPARCQSQPPAGDNGRQLREQAKRLEHLFHGPAASDDASGGPATRAAADAPAALRAPALLRDLPLWRVQWAVLPGFQEVLHVHVPHYCDALSRVLAGPQPWRFGHLYLPGGSANLGDPCYALEPGSQAPLVGTLMEVLQAVAFPDGRLLILAAGVARFKASDPREFPGMSEWSRRNEGSRSAPGTAALCRSPGR